MNTIVISHFKHRKDAELMFELAKKISGKAKKMSEKEWENYVLGIMATEGEKDVQVASREEVSKWFKE